MAVDLSDTQYVDSLKREVTPLGTTLFADVTNSQWTGYLSDAFWEARIDGFFVNYAVDEDGILTNTAGGADLDRRYIALIILYAGIKVLRNRILNTKTQFRAKAGSVEFEQQNSAIMLAEMLKQLRTAKDRIIEATEGDQSPVLVLDALSVRMFSVESYYGGLELTGGGL